jgi:hypothetical protein
LHYFVISLAIISLGMLASTSALSHSLGQGGKARPTPPMKTYFDELRTLQQSLPNGTIRIRGVIDQFKLWPTHRPLILCFKGGSPALRAIFVQTSRRWTDGTALKFDFGRSPEYRNCTPVERSDIRISFVAGPDWSYIGTDSLRFEDTTLNIGYAAAGPLDKLDRKLLEGLVLHEMGHALGLEHEHQSPEAKCEDEFDWPRVYKIASGWGWTRAEVDFNMRALAGVERLRLTPYDRQSIMHYYFEPEFFKRTRESPCFVGHNHAISAGDSELVRASYPPAIAAQDRHLQARADAASRVLGSLDLSAPQLSLVGLELGQVLAAGQRKLALQFDLAAATGKTVTRGPGQFQTCTPQAHANAAITCEVAIDGSALVIAVEPN